MTKKIGSLVILEATPPEDCSRCGNKRECRDLLGDGKPVCFGCSTTTERNAYGKRLFGIQDEQ